MPYSATMARAICVAFSRSFWAPVEISPNTSSSATRPPMAYASMSLSSGSVARKRSSSGRVIVRPSAAVPRGMIVMRCTGSRFSE